MKKEMEFQLDDKGSAKKVKNYRLMFFCLQKITSQQLNIFFFFLKTADRRMLFFDTENFIFRRTVSAA